MHKINDIPREDIINKMIKYFIQENIFLYQLHQNILLKEDPVFLEEVIKLLISQSDNIDIHLNLTPETCDELREIKEKTLLKIAGNLINSIPNEKVFVKDIYIERLLYVDIEIVRKILNPEVVQFELPLYLKYIDGCRKDCSGIQSRILLLSEIAGNFLEVLPLIIKCFDPVILDWNSNKIISYMLQELEKNEQALERIIKIKGRKLKDLLPLLNPYLRIKDRIRKYK